MNWEIVMGLETHVELSTESKIFCGCSTSFGAAPNRQCCPVCMGLPGALPVLNEKVVEYGVKVGLALGCSITPVSRFDRKNYFYPDLPKGYQISQLYAPLCTCGRVEVAGTTIGIHEIHMEEDAGKLYHAPATGETLCDFNRCGVPLLEIVTEPDFRTPEQVVAYLELLRERLQYLGVSDGKMEEGSLRCDVNLSVRPVGGHTLGTRTEMKNLGSFKAIARAIQYESQRQIALLERGERVVQETRRFDEEKGETFSMRSKEEARDYRYFPEPDLPPVVLSQEYIQDIRDHLPELGEAKRRRYAQQYQLPDYDCQMVTSHPSLARFFEELIALGTPPKQGANWIMGEVLGALSARSLSPEGLTITPKTLARLIQLVGEGKLNRNTAVKVFEAVFDTDGDVDAYVAAHGLEQVQDVELVENTVAQVLEENPQSVADWRGGKEKAFGFLVGQTMRKLQGKADPQTVRRVLLEQLGQE
ncbi:Asp-tRNA(Asn)/Glu-tRNA(Gln) amidotransferase subunit GatB [Pseudoflavonifractor sp. SW1122]|uniref:Asp-tRNA(Asn)/Glu-tRNA(Gln) amidotransferase subunit GatB n=1 Tax=Pseudoflavonifractor sp. SW1122 TaxID=2530044 RepID=UPI001439C393|nr:Asp-tRNA(Asn)/Glu-tRNA(Gln) amidotransferase subunit GatB [Pseudoflavonifractor sp. SW1122]NJE74025.1 Asp-tRNA(Asn)/Glu-tRNA(Gln) amidotransferase subunit GatB [Pseudoflavonifractor sp. SW1122]